MIRHESDMIRIARVLCIFFMMSVHVPPGSEASIINNGDLAWIGTIWKDILGRASVAALSFISGYLLIGSASRRSLGEMIRRRWSALIVPMLFWNGLFVFFVISAGMWGYESSAWRTLTEASSGEVVNLMAGISGATLNVSLVFLRDMFVCSVLILLLWRLIRPFPIISLAVFFMFALFDALAPLVLRPSILFFMVAGSLSRVNNITLLRLGKLRCGLPPAVICIVSISLLNFMPHEEPAMRELSNLLLRTALTFICLIVVSQLSRYRAWQIVAQASESIFLVYLSHMITMSVFWAIWKACVGGSQDITYVIFFLLAPLLSVFFGLGLGFVLRRAPPLLRKIASGHA